MAKIWPLPCKEVLISRLGGNTSIIPTDMDGTVHHPVVVFGQKQPIETIIILYGANTVHLQDGNVCLRGHRLVVETDVCEGRVYCLLVKIKDTVEDI